jgi:hypothetical protein
MSALNAAALMTAWETGLSQPALRRALTLLAAAWPDKSVEEWGRLSIGARDAQLILLREELFGNRLEAVLGCPSCEQRLDIEFSTEDVRAEPPQEDDGVVREDGFEIRLRVPNSADLLALSDADSDDLQQRLLERCTERLGNDNGATQDMPLPAPVVRSVAARMARIDPQADVRIAMSCPDCGHTWRMTFDILTYVWNEIEEWAQRCVYEIHTLAMAYGWSEREILGLSARRRQLYIEMIGVQSP